MDSSSELIAIDVACLLPEEVNARARAISARLWEQTREGFLFDETHLPHITLVQQFVKRSSLPAICALIGEVLRDRPPLRLRILRIEKFSEVVHFAIEPHDRLQRLHEDLMNRLAPVEEPSATESAFEAQGESEPVRPEDVAWVTNYRARASYAHFAPHVTLGLGHWTEPGEPFSFVVDRVAICHLGRFCTCRVVLQEWILGAGK